MENINVNKVSDKYFIDKNYRQYMVLYKGDIKSELESIEGIYVYLIDNRYALVSAINTIDLDLIYTKFNSIINVFYPELFTLQDIKLMPEYKENIIRIESPIELSGEGTVVTIIGTGIDYLSNVFIDENGKSRIEFIWDQTIPSNGKKQEIEVPYGSVYTNEMINNALDSFKNGGNPYEIVPSKDLDGHGTGLAAIVGGEDKKINFTGIANKCKFIVIKLREAEQFKIEYGIDIPIYNLPTVYIALKFIYDYKLIYNKPIVVLFPLGTNSGNHKGNGVLEEFIESIAISIGIVIVSGTGNEGANGGHASGIINEVGGKKVIQLDVDEKQKFLSVEIWVDLPNFMTLEVISPSGESTGLIPSLKNYSSIYKYVLEDTKIEIMYFIPEITSGDELIRVVFYDLIPGIWQFRLTGDLIMDGTFDAWLPQKGITLGNTRFSPFDPYNTITNPANSRYLITVAAYNERNNNIVNFSGVASLTDYIDRVDVAAAGVNVLTIAPNNKIAIVSGTAVSAAIVAGVCALLFEWGIVKGNNPYLFGQTLKSYLDRGTYERKGDIYPNPQWGYGILDIAAIFRNMM
ncbi:S8 family peptidase [uncultured Clostridium sp.]|uniref:S8 family peptidase n=1 Tax=uncultured Clostridium sp. TaxID=59620 RepID=UPI002585B055|nr:S8 family peptidase [uncultured Clostridium sp.]